jgi:hypothetical protein
MRAWRSSTRLDHSAYFIRREVRTGTSRLWPSTCAALGGFAVALTLTRMAQAETESRQYIDAAVRGGFLASTGFGVSYGALFGVELDHRVTPAWRAGAYLERASVHSGGDTEYYHGERFEAVRFGARGQWHARPEKVIDPWLGASVGAFYTTDALFSDSAAGDLFPGRWGADVGFDAGLDFHIGRIFTIGGVIMVVIPLGNDRLPAAPEERAHVGTGVGAYYSAFFVWVPWPALRLGLTF